VLVANKKTTVMEAVALAYSSDSGKAPVVTALGRGLVAEKILERAKEFNIPIVSDSLLAHTLNQLNIGEEIPKEFYAIVAQILVAVSKMDREYGGNVNPK
jgi:flagellar biosynthesis protein